MSLFTAGRPASLVQGDVNYLTVTGVISRKISKKWRALFDADAGTDGLNAGRPWYKAGALVGLMLSNRVGVWLKGGIPFGQGENGRLEY